MPRRSLPIRVLRLGASWLLASVTAAGGAGAAVVTWPAPPGEPVSEAYAVHADGKPVAAYTARTLDEPFAGKRWDYGGPYAFASFDFSGRVVVKIRSKRPLKQVVIRPRSAGVAPRHEDDHTIVLALDRPRKLVIEPDGKRGPLILFANAPEQDVPKAGDPGVVHFGPGLHKPDVIRLRSGQILYLAGGAVVKGAVEAVGSNITIRGRGILDGSDWPWRKGPIGNMIALRGENLSVSGIILRGSFHWTIVPRGCRNVTIRDVKICNSRVQNDDGINPCNSRQVLIQDCFIRSDDDCVAMKGLDFKAANSDVEDIRVEDCVFWCDRARIFLLGHESRAAHMRRIVVRNLDIVHFTMTPFLLEPGEEMVLGGVRFEDIRLHGEGQRSLVRLRPVVNQYMWKKAPGHVRGVAFKDVVVDGGEGEYRVELMGADPDHAVRDVTFENVRIGGKSLTREAKPVRIGANVQGVSFK
jgi:hypothetical protein